MYDLYNFLRQVSTRLTLILTRTGSDWPAAASLFFLRQPSNQSNEKLKEKKNIVMIFFLDTYRKKLLPKYKETLH